MKSSNSDIGHGNSGITFAGASAWANRGAGLTTISYTQNRISIMHGGYQYAYTTLASQNLSYSTSGGTAVSTTGFSNMTQYVRLSAPGAISANSGFRYAVGKAPAATSTSTLLPLNWVEVIQMPAGSQISALSNDSSGGTLSEMELG